MTTFNHGAFVKRWRQLQPVIPADLYGNVMSALEAGLAGGGGTVPPAPRGSDPAWVTLARAEMGQREIPGRAHNARIVDWFKRARAAWFTDDETPWCGAFAGAMMALAGHDIPAKGEAVRAKAWAAWGKPTPPRVGAVAVFGREGGGHVGFVVGQDATRFYVLGGNQGNQVSIAPIAAARLIAMRWPADLPLSDTRLPTMSGGATSRNEA